MTVVIRPSPDVFRRVTPLLVVFGAYVSPGEAPGTASGALEALVSEARRFRVALAFCRDLAPGSAGNGGTWRPGCRPTVRDMVFDLGGRGCFADPAFARSLALRPFPEICLCGPEGDSLLARSVAEGLVRNVQFSVLDLAEALRQRSTPGVDAGSEVVLDGGRGMGYALSTEIWLGRLRNRTMVAGHLDQ